MDEAKGKSYCAKCCAETSTIDVLGEDGCPLGLVVTMRDRRCSEGLLHNLARADPYKVRSISDCLSNLWSGKSNGGFSEGGVPAIIALFSNPTSQ